MRRGLMRQFSSFVKVSLAFLPLTPNMDSSIFESRLFHYELCSKQSDTPEYEIFTIPFLEKGRQKVFTVWVPEA